MVGSGIASSLVHEVGHQGAALLDLVPTLRAALAPLANQTTGAFNPWRFWDRWISEIVADLWSVARIGVGSTLGLMAVLSLPSAFVFRLDLDDPHPMPWLRAKLSCALGDALYPHVQWRQLAETWERLYPVDALEPATLQTLRALDQAVPQFVRFLLAHRAPKLRGRSLGQTLACSQCQPALLLRVFRLWKQDPDAVYTLRPSLALAAIGQAKASGLITPAAESTLLSRLLTFWAQRSALEHAKCLPPVSIVPKPTMQVPPRRRTHVTSESPTN
jgi:hypothetical protein